MLRTMLLANMLLLRCSVSSLWSPPYITEYSTPLHSNDGMQQITVCVTMPAGTALVMHLSPGSDLTSVENDSIEGRSHLRRTRAAPDRSPDRDCCCSSFTSGLSTSGLSCFCSVVT